MKAHLRFLIAIFFFSSAGYAQCVESFPYAENFDGTSWVVPVTINQSGSIAACWTRNPNSANYIWVPGPSSVVNANTGPLGDHTSGTGKFMYTETAAFSNPVPPTNLLTPFIDLSNTTAPEVSFWYHMYGFAISSLTLQASDGSSWTTLNTVTGQQQTSNTANWVKVTASLSGFVGDTIRIRFVGQKSSFSNLSRIAIDDLNVAEAPTCTPPSALFTTNTTANSTQIGWQVGSASSTSWEIEYGPAGFTPGNGTIVTATTNPYTLTGLSGSTTYAIYVREVCSATDKSPWEGPAITNTACSGALAVPYTENFDASTWQPYVNFTNQGTLGNCWIKNPSSGFTYQWLVNPNALFSFNSGPSADHTTGSGKYVATQLNGTSNTAILRSPRIDLSNVSNPELKFYYHMYGAGIDELEVDIKPAVGGSWTNLTTITGQQQTSSTAAWLNSTLSLAAYNNQTVFIRFVATKNSFNGTTAKIAIDDLTILQGSSCPVPNGLSVSNVTATSASVSWNTITGAQYEIKYGAPSFNPSTAGTSVTASNSPTVISPLTPGTSYDVYVRRLCSNDSSSWDGPVSFSTDCIDTAPFLEDFESSDWTVSPTFPQTLGDIDDCWNRSTVNTYAWAPGPEAFPSFQTGPQNDHTTGSGKFMFTHTVTFGGSGTLNADLESPSIDLSALTIPELTFWYHMYGSQIGSLIVQINDGTGWSNLVTITGQQQTSKTAAWSEQIISLAAYANDTVKLRFRGTKTANTFNTEIAIDDVDIHEQPSCPKPQNLASANVTFNSVSINWTSGGASDWIIKYGAPGFSPAAGTYTAIGSNPYVINGLTQNAPYEIWVRDSCGTNDVSDWAGPIFVRTACSPVSVPYTQNFDGSSFEIISFFDIAGSIDNCYLRSDTIEYYWGPGPASFSSFQTGPSADHTSGSGQYLYTRTGAFLNTTTSTNFVTPWIDASSLTLPQLSFWYHMFGTNISSLIVRARRYDGSQQIVKTISGQQQTSSAQAWNQEVINLNNFVGDTIRLIFTATTNGLGFRSEIAIDDIGLNNPQNCTDPTNLAASNATTTSIDLTWNSSAAAAGSTIEYGQAGFTQGNGNFIYSVTSPYTVNNLAPNTLYDFYVRDSCSWGGLSGWIGPESDSTLSCPSVGASFSFNITGLSVSFNAASSTGSPTSYTWDYGDGNSGTGVTATNNYASGGIYNVMLIVENNCGSSDTIIQTVAICQAISGAFTTTQNILTVDFDANTSSGTGLSYDWLYGDGNSGTGITSTHTYASTGTYAAALVLTDTCGNVDTVLQNLTVCDSLNPQIVLSRNGFVCDFSLNDTTGITNYNWNFGDGNTGSGASPMHTYANTGTYNITVTVTNICGEQATATYLLTLCIQPEASWTYTILSSNSGGMTVQFDGSASIGANTFLWEFGDGATNNISAIPVHTYVPAGLFWVVKLTIENSCGDTDFLLSSLASIGLNDLNKEDVKAFPNPVDDELILVTPSYLHVQSIQMVDMSGKIIQLEQTETGAQTKLNTQNLPDGAYILKVETDTGDITFNLIVRH